MSIPVKTQLKLSLSSARFLIFASRGSGVGESKVFRLFRGGGSIEGDRSEFDAVDICGVVFLVLRAAIAFQEKNPL